MHKTMFWKIGNTDGRIRCVIDDSLMAEFVKLGFVNHVDKTVAKRATRKKAQNNVDSDKG